MWYWLLIPTRNKGNKDARGDLRSQGLHDGIDVDIEGGGEAVERGQTGSTNACSVAGEGVNMECLCNICHKKNPTSKDRFKKPDIKEQI